MAGRAGGGVEDHQHVPVARWTCTSTGPRLTGTVTRVEYHPGKFLPAYKKEAGELNEWTEVWFDRPGGPVVVRQIVGILARRIVCRLKAGDRCRPASGLA